MRTLTEIAKAREAYYARCVKQMKHTISFVNTAALMVRSKTLAREPLNHTVTLSFESFEKCEECAEHYSILMYVIQES